MTTCAVERCVGDVDPPGARAEEIGATPAGPGDSAKPGTSARRVAANRLNALKSTGPRTAAGKARSARNALRHGARAKVYELGNHLDRGEAEADTEAYADHVAAAVASHRPGSVEEESIVRELADVTWRAEQTARRQERAAAVLGPDGVTPEFLMAWLEADARITGRLLVVCRQLRRVVTGRGSAGIGKPTAAGNRPQPARGQDRLAAGGGRPGDVRSELVGPDPVGSDPVGPNALGRRTLGREDGPPPSGIGPRLDPTNGGERTQSAGHLRSADGHRVDPRQPWRTKPRRCPGGETGGGAGADGGRRTQSSHRTVNFLLRASAFERYDPPVPTG